MSACVSVRAVPDITADILARALENARLRIRECHSEELAARERGRLHRAHHSAILAYAASVQGFEPPPPVEGFEPAPDGGASLDARLSEILAAVADRIPEATADTIAASLGDIAAALSRIEAGLAAAAARPQQPRPPFVAPRAAPRLMPDRSPSGTDICTPPTGEELGREAREWGRETMGRAIVKALGTAVASVTDETLMEDPDVQAALSGLSLHAAKVGSLRKALAAGAANGYLARTQGPGEQYVYNLSPAARGEITGGAGGR